jgi:hypothetical protein
VDELAFVEDEDDWAEAEVECDVEPEEALFGAVVVVELPAAVEFDAALEEGAGVDDAVDAQEAEVGTLTPTVSQSWSAKVIVAGSK